MIVIDRQILPPDAVNETLMIEAATFMGNPVQLVQGLKDGTVTIYPQPLTLKVIDYLPLSLINRFASNAIDAAGQSFEGEHDASP